MTATTANPWSAAGPNAPAGPRDRRRNPQKWGNPVTYFIALLVIAVCIAPVAYIVIGGFRTNAQITTNPAGFPHP